MIVVRASGLVYRNPKPYLRAIHAWHPSIVRLPSGQLLCTFDLGQAVESLDYRTYISRSGDWGQSWSEPVPLLADHQPPRRTHTMRISLSGDGSLVGFGGRFHRDDADEGLTNRSNMGFVPMELILSHSRDEGRSWDPPVTIEPPLRGPAFEICHAIIELRDGRWLAPTQTWRGWDGDDAGGMRAIALVSHDQGRTWPRYIEVMNEPGVLHFEQSLVQLQDGRLLAVAWRYEERSGRTLPTPYTLSADGKTFSPPRDTPLRAQTAKLLVLRDGRVLCVCRRDDQPGLWAYLVQVKGDQWINLHEALLWSGSIPAADSSPTSTSQHLAMLKLGYPQMVQLPDGDVMAVLWCMEQDVYNIRWVRIGIEPSPTAAGEENA